MSSRRSKKKKWDNTWWGGLLSILMSLFWLLTTILVGGLLVFCCWLYFSGFHDTSEELRALYSMQDKGFVELPSTKTVDSSLDGRVVFVQGKVSTQEVLQDPDLAISMRVLALHRYVRFLQWNERHSKSGGSHNPQYELEWKSSPEDGSSFNEPKNNTLILPLKSSAIYSMKNTLGAYTVAPSLLEELPIRHDMVLNVDQDFLQGTKEKILQYAGMLTVLSESMQAYFSGNIDQGSTPLVGMWSESELFLGLDAYNTRAGDLRIRYSYTPEQTVSFFATVQGNSLHLFVDEDGDASRATVREGLVGMEKILSSTKENNIIYFFINLFVAPIAICLLLLILLQLVYPEGFSRKDFSRSPFRHNIRQAFRYGMGVVVILSLMAWFH